jgi:hypothetical protein
MKIELLADVVLYDVQLLVGQKAIVSDDDGASLVAQSLASSLAEDAHGGFAVPMQTQP